MLIDHKWSIDHDVDYGIDHRSGYSATIDGAQLSEFELSPEIALARAIQKWYDYHPEGHL